MLENFKIEKVIVPLLQSNCYILRKDNDCVIVDCGGEQVYTYVLNNNLNVVAILLTHGHFDHMEGTSLIISHFDNCKVYAHIKEKEVFEDPDKNLTSWGKSKILTGITYLDDNDELEFFSEKFKIIWTPGHTIGGCCYYIEKEGLLFSGDTLFRETYGRYDLPTSSVKDLCLSINNKLLKLPEDVIVYPGHGESTTIKHEIEFNEIAKEYIVDWAKKL